MRVVIKALLSISLGLAASAGSALAHDGAHGAGTPDQTKALRCNVIGLKPLKQFVIKREAFCFKTDISAAANGYLPYPSAKRSGGRVGTAVSCRALGVTSLGAYFTKRQTRCFRSKKDARRAGFTRFVAPTPTPTVPGQATATPTLAPGQPTPTPTPLPTPIPDTEFFEDASTARNVTLSDPDGVATTLTGSCRTAFNAQRTLFKYNCTSNVTSDYEAHIEGTGILGKWCSVPFNQGGNTSQSFSRICRVDAQFDGANPAAPAPQFTDFDWRDIILGQRTGNGIYPFVSIHRARGAENEQLNGYIIAPD